MLHNYYVHEATIMLYLSGLLVIGSYIFKKVCHSKEGDHIEQMCYSKGQTVTEFDKICLYTFTIHGIVLIQLMWFVG